MILNTDKKVEQSMIIKESQRRAIDTCNDHKNDQQINNNSFISYSIHIYFIKTII